MNKKIGVKNRERKMKAVSLGLQNEPEQARLVIVANRMTYMFDLNDDQLMLLLHQISHALYANCRQVRRLRSDEIWDVPFQYPERL